MSGAGHMSDLLSPVVGGLLPPAGVILFFGAALVGPVRLSPEASRYSRAGGKLMA